MITQSHVHEVAVHKFQCDASDLYDAEPNFRSGWPRHIKTTLGNGQSLVMVRRVLDPDGDTIYVLYRQELGCIDLKVFND